MEVYKAIAAVQHDLAATGIGKNSENKQQGFKFRGIDAVYNALAPLLAKHLLCILPRVIDRTTVERTTKNGGALFYTTVKCEFDFVSAVDGSKHTVATYGEGMDSADKGTNKALSAAYKYAAFQAFCIPTEETAVDADAQHHEVRSTETDRVMEFVSEMDQAPDLDTLQDVFKRAWKATKGHKAVKAHYDNLKAKMTPPAAEVQT